MRAILCVATAVAATGLVASVAQATLTVSLVSVPITAAAKTADPALNNARSYDLRVNEVGEKWNVATLQTTLGTGGTLAGSFYAPANHSDTKLIPAPTANLNFDTSLTTPQFNAQVNNSQGGTPQVSIVGHADSPANPGPGNPATAAAVMPSTGGANQVMNVVWGDQAGNLSTQPDGTYSIARITVLGNTGAYLNGYVLGTVSQTPVTFHNLYLPLLGDTDGNGSVALQDLFNVQNNFGLNANGDADGDGDTDLADLFAVQNQFGNTITAPPGAALGSLVPEPGCLGLAAIGSLAVVRRRRAAK